MSRLTLLLFGALWLCQSALPTEAQELQPGNTFRDCPECPEMVVVPAGSFIMGSPAPEAGHERPRHRVEIAKPFAVGKYEVTFAEWDACVADGGCNGYRPKDGRWGRGERPVINVSWRSLQAYVDWLNRKTGKGYRLLSEAEWEYAARAGATTPFHFGSTMSTDQANYNGDDTYGGGRKGVSHGKTVAVGSYPANAFGLHDMLGNVWEWVADCWHGDYVGAPSDGSAWATGATCDLRVLRGGSWHNAPRSLHLPVRARSHTESRYNDSGFRVARPL